MATYAHTIFPIGTGLPTVDYPHVNPRFTLADPGVASRRVSALDQAETARATNAMLASLASMLIGGDHV